MDPFIGMLAVFIFFKVMLDDGYSTVTGKPNPRLQRRQARQRSRSNNRVWRAFVDYLGDLAEYAHDEAKQKLNDRRERKERERRNRDVIEAEVVEDDVQDAEVVEDPPAAEDPPPSPTVNWKEHAELADSECEWDLCPVHPKNSQEAPPTENNVIPINKNQGTSPHIPGGDTMSEVLGLDQAVAYARSVAGVANQHSTSGAEQYIGHLTEREVQGEALQSAYDMQAAFSAAAAAAEKHADELEKMRSIQEGYTSNPDAGDKQFMTTGR
jgi:hypothetical protein